MKISVVISTYNREKLLRECLESIKSIADEIIVIDNSSSDNSVALAKKYTPHVFVRKNNHMLNINKNFGIGKATKEWVLYLDDDEQLTPELVQEIGNWKLEIGNSEVVGYYIPRRNIIYGKWIKHTGWYPDYQLRLFKKGKGKYPEIHVHEMIQVTGETGYLTNPIEHENYRSVQEFITKTTILYAPNEARVLLQNGYVFSPVDAIRMPAKEFISRYFAREGFKDGLHGLVLSLLMSFYHLVVFAYLWEINRFIEVESEHSYKDIVQEVKKIKKEFYYWIYTLLLSKETNPLKKLLLKWKRKL